MSLCITACRVQEYVVKDVERKRPPPVFGLVEGDDPASTPRTGTTNQDSSPSRSRRRRGAGTRTRIGPMSRRVRSGHGSGAGAGSARPRRRGPRKQDLPPRRAKPKAAPRAGGGAVPGARKKSGIEFRLFVSYNSYERTTLEITAPARRRQQRRAWISDRIRELEQERLHSARGAWHRCLACELLQVQEPHHRTAA